MVGQHGQEFTPGEFLYAEEGHVHKYNTILIDYSDIDLIVEFIANQRGYSQAFLLPESSDYTDIEMEWVNQILCLKKQQD
jgi:hypothetical protein